MKASVRERLLARPSTKGTFNLSAIDPSKTPGTSKSKAARELPKDAEKLAGLQERLYAEGKRSLLLVLQGMDASGKDGTVSENKSGMWPAITSVSAGALPL